MHELVWNNGSVRPIDAVTEEHIERTPLWVKMPIFVLTLGAFVSWVACLRP